MSRPTKWISCVQRDVVGKRKWHHQNVVAVVVAKVLVPEAVSVPLVINDDVAVIVPPVIVPPVSVVKNEVTPFMIEATSPVVVVVAEMFALVA